MHDVYKAECLEDSALPHQMFGDTQGGKEWSIVANPMLTFLSLGTRASHYAEHFAIHEVHIWVNHWEQSQFDMWLSNAQLSDGQ